MGNSKPHYEVWGTFIPGSYFDSYVGMSFCFSLFRIAAPSIPRSDFWDYMVIIL